MLWNSECSLLDVGVFSQSHSSLPLSGRWRTGCQKGGRAEREEWKIPGKGQREKARERWKGSKALKAGWEARGELRCGQGLLSDIKVVSKAPGLGSADRELPELGLSQPSPDLDGSGALLTSHDLGMAMTELSGKSWWRCRLSGTGVRAKVHLRPLRSLPGQSDRWQRGSQAFPLLMWVQRSSLLPPLAEFLIKSLSLRYPPQSLCGFQSNF